MRFVTPVLLLGIVVAGMAAGSPPPPAPGTLTGKERMRGKAFDEQRVDDCKVPPERRTRPRPTACPGEPKR